MIQGHIVYSKMLLLVCLSRLVAQRAGTSSYCIYGPHFKGVLSCSLLRH